MTVPLCGPNWANSTKRRIESLLSADVKLLLKPGSDRSRCQPSGVRYPASESQGPGRKHPGWEVKEGFPEEVFPEPAGKQRGCRAQGGSQTPQEVPRGRCGQRRNPPTQRSGRRVCRRFSGVEGWAEVLVSGWALQAGQCPGMRGSFGAQRLVASVLTGGLVIQPSASSVLTPPPPNAGAW